MNLRKATKPIPAIEQHAKMKAWNPGDVVFVRTGDFMETFGPDAVVAANVLSLTLTKRGSDGMAMCGFPYMRMGDYREKLQAAGYPVTAYYPS